MSLSTCSRVSGFYKITHASSMIQNLITAAVRMQ